MTRAAVYARLSRRKAAAEMGVNIGDQQSIGKQLVERRGWTLLAGPTDGTFTDDGKGAFQDDAKRPEWEAMLAEKPDVIVVRDAARLGRNIPDYADLIRTKARVVLWLDDDSGDVRWDAEPEDTRSEGFLNAQVGSRLYSQKISKGVKRKNRVKAQAGGWPHGGTRPFGYHHPPNCCANDECKPGAIIESEAEIIREAAARWLGGENLSGLCRDLTERGVRTPAGKPWQYSRLRAMLTGPRIAGIRVYNGVEHPGSWPAIIDEDLHRRLQTRETSSMVKRANANGVYLLSGIVFCGVCSETGETKKMYGHRQHGGAKGVRLRYICREGCGQGAAMPQLDEFVFNKAFMSILAPEFRNQDESRRELDAHLAEVADLEERLVELDKAYWEERSIPKDRWLSVSTTLNDSLTASRAAADDIKQRLGRVPDAPTTAEGLSERWLKADTPERTRLLKVALDKVLIHAVVKTGNFDPTRIEFYYRNGRAERVKAEDLVPVGN